MSTREQVVERAAAAIVEAYGEDAAENCPCEQDWDVARAVVAALLPQVATVEELEALPVGTLLKGADGDVWQGSPNGFDCLSEDGTAGAYDLATVARRSAPLTAVWQP